MNGFKNPKHKKKLDSNSHPKAASADSKCGVRNEKIRLLYRTMGVPKSTIYAAYPQKRPCLSIVLRV
jgi:hypothetical protein